MCLVKNSCPEYIKKLLHTNMKKRDKLTKSRKDLNAHITNKRLEWQINIWKTAQLYCLSGKCTLKPKWNITTHPSNLKIKKFENTKYWWTRGATRIHNHCL